MANIYRNEKEIKLGAEIILLRPTFENIADMESNMGGVVYLAWKFGKPSSDGSVASSIKNMPGFTELAQIIYYNQAARREDDSTKRKFSLEEIWEFMQDDGMALMKPVTEYLSVVMAGSNRLDAPASSAEKKS